MPTIGEIARGMAHHRCTRCKQESYPRYKYEGGVYCDDCINDIRCGFGRRRSWLGSIWDRIVELADIVFKRKSPKHTQRAEERAIRSKYKAMEAKARSIPSNPQQASPQKH